MPAGSQQFFTGARDELGDGFIRLRSAACSSNGDTIARPVAIFGWGWIPSRKSRRNHGHGASLSTGAMVHFSTVHDKSAHPLDPLLRRGQ